MISVGDALAVMFFSILAMMLGAATFAQSPTTMMIITNLLLVLPLWLIWRRRAYPLQLLFPFRGMDALREGLFWRLLLGTLLASDLLDYLLEHLIPLPEDLAAHLQETFGFQNPLQVLGLFLGVVLLGPLVEELIFRGFFYRFFRDREGVTNAVLKTSLLFLFFHLNFYWSLQLLLFAFLLGLLRWRSKSLWPPLLLHVTNNLVSLVALNLPENWPERGGVTWWLAVLAGTLLFADSFRRYFFSDLTQEETPDE